MREKYGTDSMGQTAENVAEQYGVSRDDQDAFALRSQQKAAAARSAGRFAPEIVPVEIPQKKGAPKVVDTDEFIRADTTLEILAKLRPAFRTDGKGSVTAGNSSGLNDGAAALLIGSERGARELGIAPMARIVATAVAGVEPRLMGMGPVPASKRALELAGISLDQMDVIELNEAFAAQSLACLRELGIADDDPRVNPNGGAIALGHPLGMSGARLLLTASHELQRTGKRYALCDDVHRRRAGHGDGAGACMMANIFAFDDFVPVIHESAFIHPNATVTGNVIIGRDVYVGTRRGNSRRLGRHRDRGRLQRAGELHHPHVPRRDRRARARRAHRARRHRARRAHRRERAHRHERGDHGQRRSSAPAASSARSASCRRRCRFRRARSSSAIRRRS